jgi:hypothetical protein
MQCITVRLAANGNRSQGTSLSSRTDTEAEIERKRRGLDDRYTDFVARLELAEDAFTQIVIKNSNLGEAAARETAKGLIHLTRIEEEILEEFRKYPRAASSDLIRAAINKAIQDTAISLSELPNAVVGSMRDVSSVLAGVLMAGHKSRTLIHQQGNAIGISSSHNDDGS